ncbi:MAG TPA: hypothetical protein VGH59_16350 [Casimicrobiaceae bacterium]|jgi:hypothetical protein
MHRVNLFQAAMLRWRALYPYNAVHVIEIPGALDRARLRASIRDHLQGLGLTGLIVDPRQQSYEWTGGEAAIELRSLEPVENVRAALREAIERELNAAFPAEGRVEPFRFFVVEQHGAFHLGLAYDHFIAGGDSIVALLQGIVAHYAEPLAKQTSALQPYGPSYARLLGSQTGAIVRGLPALARMTMNCRRSIRLRYAAPQDGYNAFLLERIERDDRARLEAGADAWGITTHDLLIAILITSVAPLAHARGRSGRRNEIAIASIVNIRRDLGPQARDALAPCLASFRVSHRMDDNAKLRDVALAVYAQTDAIKRGKRYLQTLLALGLAGLEWGFMSLPQRHRFFPKHFPVCAGTTPLNVDALWSERGDDELAGYVRGVSTGPLAPMVLSFTMVDGIINVGMSFRTTVFERGAAEGVAAAMLRMIRTL